MIPKILSLRPSRPRQPESQSLCLIPKLLCRHQPELPDRCLLLKLPCSCWLKLPARCLTRKQLFPLHLRELILSNHLFRLTPLSLLQQRMFPRHQSNASKRLSSSLRALSVSCSTWRAGVCATRVLSNASQLLPFPMSTFHLSQRSRSHQPPALTRLLNWWRSEERRVGKEC